MSFTLFGSRSRGHQYDNFVPSGEKTGKPSNFVFPVTARMAPVATSRIRTVLCVAVSRVRRLDADEREELSVRRPRQGRGRRARREGCGEAPGAGRQPLRLASVGRDEPDVDRHRGLGHEEVVVAHLEEVVPLLDLRLVRPLVFGGVRERLSVRAPREVLDAGRRARHLLRLAARHREDEDLGLRFLLRPVEGEEGETIAGGRPARVGDPLPVARQDAPRARRHVDEVELGDPLVLLDVGARHDDGD